MTMTAEQNEQWQRAVMRAYPAPTPNGQNGTLEQWKGHHRGEAVMLALLPEKERREFLDNSIKFLYEHPTEWPLPGWVLTIRDQLVFHGYYQCHPKSEFAFRYDVALLGLQALHPTSETREAAYQNLLIRYLPRTLRPLVEKTVADNDANMRQSFEGYHQICQLCESDGLYWDQERWLEIERSFGPNRSVIPYHRIQGLVEGFVMLARQVLFHAEEPDPEDENAPMPPNSLMHHFASLAAHHLEFDIAGQAFLEALEAECPPPDWLP